MFHQGRSHKTCFWKKFSSVFVVIILLLVIFEIIKPNSSAECTTCPQPASSGRQPYPTEMAVMFLNAGTNRMGNNGPNLPKIWKGYTSPQEINGYVPCILLKAIAYTESTGWKQFVANYGVTGNTLISADCGYGVMQITSGMGGGLGFDPQLVAREPAYNIGTGAKLLIDKWNALNYYIGENNPYVVEDWYYSVWAYNSWGWVNNPNNQSKFPANRGTWQCGQNPSQIRANYPYQELIWGCAANPPSFNGVLLWNATNLTFPPSSLFPTTETGAYPAHIDTPMPSHSSCSVNFLPIIFNKYCGEARGERLANGNFETGDTSGWFATRTNNLGPIVLVYGSNNHGARLGRYDNNEDSLYQTVCIPNNISSAILTYSVWVYSEDSSYYAYDKMDVNIRDENGHNLIYPTQFSNISPRGQWIYKSLDLTPFAGQTIQVYFHMTTDISLQTSIWVDDISLIIN